MRFARPSRTYIVLAALLILLPLLAVLQYRWIGEVSQAERRLLEDNLNRSGAQFAEDFTRELNRVFSSFQVRDAKDQAELNTHFSERYEDWLTTPYNNLVRRVFLARTSGDGYELSQYDPGTATLKGLEWPAELTGLRDNLLARRDRPERRGVVSTSIVGSGNPEIAIPVLPEAAGPPPPPGPGPGPGQGGFGRGGRLPPQQPLGWTIVELDRKTLFDEFIPAMIGRHFVSGSAAAYRIAIVSHDNPSQVVYRSDSDFGEADARSPDLTIRLFSPDSGRGRGPGGPAPQGRPQGGAPFQRGGRGGPDFAGFGPPQGQGGAFFNSWDLLVKHRSGSLDTAVSAVRQRNLAISFGILLLLGSAVALVVASSHRARALAQLQMDFVARVSHELRTPLAIIRSAAYNVANGVVSEEQDVREYAQMVETEGQRLSTMVDQILTFSRTESGGRATYDLRAVHVEELVERVLDTMSSALKQAGCEATRDIAVDLPAVKADERALAECLQNLVSNAIKYGKSGGPATIRISARKSDSNTVQVSVADDGPGIEPSDLPHIFEPFFRGRNARSDTPGSGLGLNLVRRLMNAQWGHVTVASEPGRGACFTLHLTTFPEAAS